MTSFGMCLVKSFITKGDDNEIKTDPWYKPIIIGKVLDSPPTVITIATTPF